MLLPPDTDHIKKISPEEHADKNDIKVKFEGLEDFLGGPAPCEIYLGRVEHNHRHKKQVLFWQLTGENMTTPDEDKANMAWMNVAARIIVSGELRGDTSSNEDCFHLNHLTRQTGSVNVIFHVLVNSKSIDRKTQFLVQKERAAESEETELSNKRKATEISNVEKWDRQVVQMSAVLSAISSSRPWGLRRFRPVFAVYFGVAVATTGSRTASVSGPGLLCKLGFKSGA